MITYEERITWTLEVIEEWQDYLPLLLRQIYYQLVKHPHFMPNTKSQYKALSAALSRARKEGLIAWEWMDDTIRPTGGHIGWPDGDSYLANWLSMAHLAYNGQRMAGQPFYFEIFVEKDSLMSPFVRAANRYGVLVNMGRGYSSTTEIKRMADRLKDAEQKGYESIILAFSDFDPSGLDLVDNLRRQFLEFGLSPQVERWGLTKEQVDEYELPHNPDAFKMSDPRAPAFVEKYGRHSVQLDAFTPAQLEGLVHKAIEPRLDIKTFEAQIQKEESEREALARTIESIIEFLQL